MLKNTLFVILLMISSLFTACAEGYVSDIQKEDDTKEIRFSLNTEGGDNDVSHQIFSVFGRNEMENILF